MDHLVDEHNTLFHYCENLRSDLTNLEERVKKIEGGEYPSIEGAVHARADLQNMYAHDVVWWKNKYTEANEAYLSETFRADDAVEEICSLRRKITELELELDAK
jgi:hypothetical protein